MTPVLAAAIALGAFLFCIIPTVTLLYVEPRGRPHWAVPGDDPSKRRAPLLVRLTAWLSFAAGQTSLLWLALPASCVGLIYAHAKLGAGKPMALGILGLLAVATLLQAILSFRLLPLGVRLLVRDAKAAGQARARGRRNAVASAAFLALSFAVGWALMTIPGLMNPWVRTAVLYAVLRPMGAYAALCLVHALLLSRCSHLLGDAKPT
jgi:hypothetical protein